ncbi:MAG: 23S rRNA (pseudouridine(1915)-N(3))-methyltransferase RlmH [Flavobacteriaceae bacterium]|tara:strand:- start:6852 stop:7325 length:474 start_codon:yes stop_codon:yes gene_type:complete
MKIELIFIEKTKKIEYKNIIQDYLKRINKKITITIKEIAFINPQIQNKNISIKQTKLIQKYLDDFDHVVLLDVDGKSFSSLDFSKWINLKIASSNIKCLKFIIGGPYGFNKKNYNLKINEKISLSKMTFSHQMIRIFILEQIYRSLKIINNEPYHNE